MALDIRLFGREYHVSVSVSLTQIANDALHQKRERRKKLLIMRIALNGHFGLGCFLVVVCVCVFFILIHLLNNSHSLSELCVWCLLMYNTLQRNRCSMLFKRFTCDPYHQNNVHAFNETTKSTNEPESEREKERKNQEERHRAFS